MLEQRGFKVSSFVLDDSAFDTLPQSAPDLLVVGNVGADTELVLGWLARLRQHPALRRIPVLISTTQSQLMSLPALAQELRPFDVLAEPFNFTDAMTRIARLLSGTDVPSPQTSNIA